MLNGYRAPSTAMRRRAGRVVGATSRIRSIPLRCTVDSSRGSLPAPDGREVLRAVPVGPFVGVELNPDYWQMAKDRIEAEIARPKQLGLAI